MLALCAGAVVLLLGPGWQNFVWPFQIGWLISIGAGLGALLLLDREDRHGDLGACALLAVALGSSGVGVAFVLGAVAELVLGPRGRRDAWIVVVPLVPYGLWWVVFQDSSVVARGIPAIPGFVADQAAATVAALFGLAGPYAEQGEGSALIWGRPLAVLVAGLVIWRLRRLGRAPTRVLTLLTVVIGFWTLTGLTRSQYANVFGNPFGSRYVYLGGFVLVVLGAALLRGVHVPAKVQAIVAALVAVIVSSDLGVLIDSGRYLREQAAATRAQLGTLDIARDVVAPGYRASPFFGVITARPYFEAEARWGTPAYSVAQLAAAPDYARALADLELARIHRVALPPSADEARGDRPTVAAAVGGSVAGEGPCVTFRPQAYTPVLQGQQLQVDLPADGVLITARGGSATVGVGRFSPSFQRIGRLAADTPAILRVAGDRAPPPWRVELKPTDRVTVCGL